MFHQMVFHLLNWHVSHTSFSHTSLCLADTAFLLVLAMLVPSSEYAPQGADIRCYEHNAEDDENYSHGCSCFTYKVQQQ